MGRPLPIPLALALALLVGCTVAPTPQLPSASPRPPRAASPGPTSPGPVSPSTEPTAAPSAALPVDVQAPPATPVAPTRLAAPAGLATLRGTVRIDAAYAVGAGVGRLVGSGAKQAVAVAPASLVAAGGLNLTAPDAAQVLSHNGSTVLSHNGGTVLSHNGGVLVAAGGGNMVAAGGLNMVAAGGGNMVAAGGGNLVAAGGGNYRLQQAAGGDGQLPAAGMVVGLLDLASGGLAPVGQDADGKPVYGTYTDAAGGFAIYPPADLKGNFTVVAVAPTTVADPRLAYGVVTKPGQTDVALDEDSAIAARVIREAFSTRLAAVMVADDPIRAADEMLGGGGIAELTTPLFARLNKVAKEMGLPAAPPAERDAAARQLSDMAIATVDLFGMTVRVEQDDKSFGEPQPVVASLVNVFREMRAAADQKLASDPAFFGNQAWLKGQPIRKGADLGAFVVENYMKATRPTYREISGVFRSLKLGIDGRGNYNSYAELIDNAGQLIATAIVGVLVTDDGTTAARMEAALRARRAP